MKKKIIFIVSLVTLILCTYTVCGALSVWPNITVSEQTKATANTQSDITNSKPIAKDVSYSTAKNITLSGVIDAYDREGEILEAVVVEGAKNGKLDFVSTYFTYTPFYDYVGEDSFTVTVKDTAGNSSDICKVSIYVEDNKNTSFYYTDMLNNPSHYSAIKLNENGILTGKQVGNAYFFEPKAQVTRGEFIIDIISAILKNDSLTACVNTKLSNDSEIPLYLKPYVKVAIDEGIITEDYFHYDEIITRAEAVLLIDRASKINDVSSYTVTFDDVKLIPEWALQSYINLSAYKMLDLYQNSANPNGALTRDTSADLLWQLYKYRVSPNYYE